MNPVRAGLAAAPQDYRWSSAAVHCGARTDDEWLDLDCWRGLWSPAGWKEYLSAASEEENIEIRRCTHTGRPLGAADFVNALEKELNRALVARRGGCRPKPEQDQRQQVMQFGPE